MMVSRGWRSAVTKLAVVATIAAVSVTVWILFDQQPECRVP
jgi:hypothetical protein